MRNDKELVTERLQNVATMVLSKRQMMPQSVMVTESGGAMDAVRRTVVSIELVRGLNLMASAMVRDYEGGSINPKALPYYRDLCMDSIHNLTAAESSNLVTIFSDCFSYFGKAIQSEEWFFRFVLDEILDSCQKLMNTLKDGSGISLAYKYGVDLNHIVKSNNISLNKLNQEL